MELINEELALNLYMEIFENYTPKISKTYDSAIRLLEKRQRFTEALKICEQAIELIGAAEVSGTVERFESIKDRLLRRIAETSPHDSVVEKKAFKLKPKHIIGIFATLILLYLLLRYTTPFGDLVVNLEGKDALAGGENVFKDTTESPSKNYPVTDEMIEIATKTLLKNIDAVDATVIPQNDTLGVAIIVAPGTTSERAQIMAVEYLKALAGAASATYSDLNAPSKESLGQLYDFYELVITIGTGFDEEEFIARGTKVKGAKAIFWRQ
jgi:tetratricopeptide (TPR) repeat protein